MVSVMALLACFYACTGNVAYVPVQEVKPPVAENVSVRQNWPCINSFIVSSDNISEGDNITLSWDTYNAGTVSISPDAGKVGPSGNMMVSPRRTTRYELIAAGEKGKAVGWVDVKVLSAASLLPDLVITQVTYNSGLLYYTVKNTGASDAGPHNTWLYDLSHMHRDQSWVDGLKVGEEKTRAFSNFNYDGNEITICADGGGDVVESNEDNNCYTPYWGPRSIYEMQTYASRATWRSSNGNTAFGQISDSNVGAVNKLVVQEMEDGSSYRNVIQMIPPAESYAWIEGLFGEYQEKWQSGGYMIPMIVPVNARFTARVGMSKEAQGSSGVTFIFGLIDSSGVRTDWPGVKGSYDGMLDSIDIDLASYAGKKVMAVLRVESGADSQKNYAVWIDARITQ